jgi:hypothetical protein
MNQMGQYEIAPAYGTQVYRRRIRLVAEEGVVSGVMEDSPHAMRCRIRHAQGRVVAVDSGFERHPLTTCPGATGPLADLVGMSVAIDPKGFFAHGRARMNCTHMLDLAWLMLRHVVSGRSELLYAIDVPDEIDGRTLATLDRDGKRVLAWNIHEGVITSPPFFAGQNPRKGFVGWALDSLEGDELEAALVLHKGLYVAYSQRFAMKAGLLQDWEQDRFMGVCFGFAPERIAEAARTKPGRVDFTQDPERLLSFAAKGR